MSARCALLAGVSLAGLACVGGAGAAPHGASAPSPTLAASRLAVGSDEPAGWATEPGALLPATRARVLREAGIALSRPSRPVAQLVSAGSVELDDPRVAASRAAFEDADDALLLALAWRAEGETRYRTAAVARLLAWARTNVPTGHPVDEARLDALVVAWQLVRPTLDAAEDASVRAWLTTIRERERGWRLGPRAAVNNHRTHQLEMFILLDRALGDAAGLAADTVAAEAHAVRNLDAETGESVDLRERGALYYHAYNLDAWLEIRLATGCCARPIAAAYALLERRLLAGETGGEFEGSVAPLDAARAAAGFGYGGAGSTFDPARAEHAILTFYTGPSARRSPFAGRLTADNVLRTNVYALARYESWTR